MKCLPALRLILLIATILLVVATKALKINVKLTSIESALGASRRQFGVVVGECLVLSTQPAFATAGTEESSNLQFPKLQLSAAQPLPDGLLESRLSSNVMEPPPFGMESTDIFYPS